MSEQNSVTLPLPLPLPILRNQRTSSTDSSRRDPLRRFQPLKSCIVQRIDQTTSVSMLQSFIRQVQQTSTFVMYLSRTRPLHEEKLKEMTIELLQPHTSISKIFLIKFSALPTYTHPKFKWIKQLFREIFHSSKSIVTWNDFFFNLYPLFRRKYLSDKQRQPAKFIAIHDQFKAWYGKIYAHDTSCCRLTMQLLGPEICSCSHAGFTSFYYQWTISQAIECAFHETLINPADQTDDIYSEEWILSRKDAMAESVVFCMALSKLRMAIELQWNQSQIDQFHRYHHIDC